jgi:hypothetical protein
MLKFIKVFRSQFEVCSKIIVKNYYLDLKNQGRRDKNGKMFISLQGCGKDGSCEDAICFKSDLVSKNS